MSEGEAILVDEVEPGVRRITLNRPAALNAFTFVMYQALLDTLSATARDPAVRVVILTGSGRGFCSGHDLKAAGQTPFAATGLGKSYADRHNLRGLGAIPLALRNLPQPVIAAVNGAAAGIGYTLALAADMAIAARSATFVNTIHNAATGTELGLSYLLPRAIGAQRAAELLYTARPVGAMEAERIGLVLRTVDDDRLIEAALDVARGIIANVPIGIWLTKQSLWMNQGIGSLEAAIELEGRAVQIAQASDDAKEKRAAFWDRRPPRFTNS